MRTADMGIPLAYGAVEDAELVSLIKRFREGRDSGPEQTAQLARYLAGPARLEVAGECIADVASTGGATSLSTLISPLFLRAAGAIVPKVGVPGRPAGGIDCLAQVPGYAVNFSIAEVRAVLKRNGYAHFLAGGEIAALDGRMFQLRQSIGAQTVPELVAASLLAKKLAVGVQFAGLDIRVGPHGNFGTDRESAMRNAKLFLETAECLAIHAAPVLTDCRYPYQPYIGRRESLVALSDLFDGRASPWLLEHFRACKTLAMCCLPEGRRRSADQASMEDIRTHFIANIEAQGATKLGFEELVQETRRKHVHEISAVSDGFCAFDLGELRNAMVAWQRDEAATSRDAFADPVGVLLLRRPGEWVQKGACIATFRTPDDRRGAVLDALTRILATPRNMAENSHITEVYG